MDSEDSEEEKKKNAEQSDKGESEKNNEETPESAEPEKKSKRKWTESEAIRFGELVEKKATEKVEDALKAEKESRQSERISGNFNQSQVDALIAAAIEQAADHNPWSKASTDLTQLKKDLLDILNRFNASEFQSENFKELLDEVERLFNDVSAEFGRKPKTKAFAPFKEGHIEAVGVGLFNYKSLVIIVSTGVCYELIKQFIAWAL